MNTFGKVYIFVDDISESIHIPDEMTYTIYCFCLAMISELKNILLKL